MIQRGLRGAASDTVTLCRVLAVFDDVEIEATEVDRAEMLQFLVDQVEVELLISGDDLAL